MTDRMLILAAVLALLAAPEPDGETLTALAEGKLLFGGTPPRLFIQGEGGALLDPLTARLHGALSFHRRPAVVAAQLGPDAGLWGAAILGTDLLGLTALPRKDRGPT